MKLINIAILSASLLMITCCAIMRPATIAINEPITNYKYIYILDTKELTSSSSAFSLSFGASSTKTINPSDAIAGYLMKLGYIRVLEINNKIADKTMIVSYGESGKRNAGLGTAIEVTIQFTNSTSNALIATTTAEGQGETEADDIRKAIYRALDALFNKK